MLNIKNLSQLKQAIKDKKEFTIIKHYYHPELTGQRRKPTKVQTNAFYSIVPNEPDNKVSQANGGKGYYMPYGKAKDWEFDNGVCRAFNPPKDCYSDRAIVMEFCFD